MTSENRPSTADYDQTFLTYLNELADAQKLGENVTNRAEKLFDEITMSVRQHYEAKHMAAGLLVIASRLEGDPRTSKQVAQSLEALNGNSQIKNRIENGNNGKKQLISNSGAENNANTQLSEQYGKDHIREVRKCMKRMRKHENLNLDPVLADDFLEVILKHVDVDESLREKCWDLMDKVIDNYRYHGKSQIGIASAIVYLSSKEEEEAGEVSVEKLSQFSARKKKTIKDAAQDISQVVS